MFQSISNRYRLIANKKSKLLTVNSTQTEEVKEEEVEIVCATQNSRRAIWRRSEMKHIMKILECVVSYQPIRIAFLRLHRSHPTSRFPPQNSTRQILIALFQSTRIVFMYTQLALHHFRFFFFPRNSSRKNLSFSIFSPPLARWAHIKATLVDGGRIEERFIIIFIAFRKFAKQNALWGE